MLKPLVVTELKEKFNVFVRVRGGGLNGQAGALKLGIARALEKNDPDLRKTLKSNDLLTRDPREVERKKPGRHKARKSTQFSKR